MGASGALSKLPSLRASWFRGSSIASVAHPAVGCARCSGRSDALRRGVIATFLRNQPMH